MYLGRPKLGDTLYLMILADQATLTSAPPLAPIAAIYDFAGNKVFSSRMPPLDPYGTGAGLFSLPVRLGSVFGLGQYRVSYNYRDQAGNPRVKTGQFQIVDGGNPAGNVIACWFYPRPQANFLVMRTDADTRLLARNPRQ